MNKTTIGVIEFVIILLSVGTTIYIKDAGTKTSCRNGFEYILNGEYEGYHSCTTSSGIRYELCFEVYNSSTGRVNYWCKKGIKVEVPIEVPYITGSHKGNWKCPPKGCEII